VAALLNDQKEEPDQDLALPFLFAVGNESTDRKTFVRQSLGAGL
jgi:hypothetical protein